uniref:BPTI/Kunitz inhibitor domain-containing protein n=1 Tax=Haplochromis burtoni TaxID=8153 RepID=A0A3Q2WJG0_HAPBU
QADKQSELCICFLGKDAGDCVNYTVRWFFDHKRSVCSRFWYSGCGGNENRFATQAECAGPPILILSREVQSLRSGQRRYCCAVFLPQGGTALCSFICVKSFCFIGFQPL